MIKVNPRVAMFAAMQVKSTNHDTFIALSHFFSSSEVSKFDVSPERQAISFRHKMASHLVKVGQYIVKDRLTGNIRIVDEEDFPKMYYQYEEPAGKCPNCGRFAPPSGEHDD